MLVGKDHSRLLLLLGRDEGMQVTMRIKSRNHNSGKWCFSNFPSLGACAEEWRTCPGVPSPINIVKLTSPSAITVPEPAIQGQKMGGYMILGISTHFPEKT